MNTERELHLAHNIYKCLIALWHISYNALVWKQITLVSKDSVWIFMKTTGTPDAWEALSHAFPLARVSSKSLGREATLSEALGRKRMERKQLELGTGSVSCIFFSHGYGTYPSWSLVVAIAFTILDVLVAAMQCCIQHFRREREDTGKQWQRRSV